MLLGDEDKPFARLIENDDEIPAGIQRPARSDNSFDVAVLAANEVGVEDRCSSLR